MLIELNNENVEIDDNIVDEIIILNNKGYTTFACCGGHVDRECYLIDVVFKEPYGLKLEPPNGFKWYKNVGLEFYIHKNKSKCLLKYENAMIEFKKWVKDLPNNDGDDILPFNRIKTDSDYIFSVAEQHGKVILHKDGKPVFTITKYDEK
ncbi:MAG: hypothetical protein AB7V16_08310 [Vulcanibacillus sp.]